MIVINGIFTADAETIAALVPAITKMEQASLAEDGCDDYCFSIEASNPGMMRVTERWESAEHLKAHFATPHMTEFQAAMAANPTKGAEIHCYEADEVDFPPF